MKKILAYIFILCVLSGNFSLAEAQVLGPANRDTYTLLEPLPCIEGTGNNCTANESGVRVMKQVNLKTYIEYLFKFAIALAVFLATVMIIYGGFQWMISEIPYVKVDAKEKISNAIFGLAAALISYLVLQTIDPRLVQINATIPPIKVDVTEAEKFVNKFQEDLRNQSADKRIEILELENQKIELDKTITDLEARIARGDVKPADMAAVQAELEKLKLERSNINLKQIVRTAEGLGLVNYRLAHEQLYNAQNYVSVDTLSQFTAAPVENKMIDRKYPVNSPNVIQNRYNQKINEVLAIQPQTKETVSAIRQLEFQREFYIAEVKEEVNLNNLIRGHGQTRSTGTQGTYKADNKIALQEKRTEYQNNLKDPGKALVAGVTPEEYDGLMQQRIDVINKTIGTK